VLVFAAERDEADSGGDLPFSAPLTAARAWA